jgi:hypothetical protein
MGEQLAEPGLGGEDPAAGQGARHFAERVVAPCDVEAGSEVDHQIEVVIGEGQLANIGDDELGPSFGLA